MDRGHRKQESFLRRIGAARKIVANRQLKSLRHAVRKEGIKNKTPTGCIEAKEEAENNE